LTCKLLFIDTSPLKLASPLICSVSIDDFNAPGAIYSFIETAQSLLSKFISLMLPLFTVITSAFENILPRMSSFPLDFLYQYPHIPNQLNRNLLPLRVYCHHNTLYKCLAKRIRII